MEERRIVTVLFCDVTGSTSLASHLDPEEWAEIIAEVFPLLIEPVERYGGTVARLMGDAVLAFFGAPIAHEDDSQRAILAGLAIIDGLQAFRDEIRNDYGQDFNVRIGINTGIVVVGAFGTEQTFEYTAMGDAVNLAARMEQTATPGTIQVAAPTYRLAMPYFDFEPLGEIEVRGKDEPVSSYRVLGRTTTPARYRGNSDVSVPTLGRELERAALADSLSRLNLGQGGIVSIIGEAGLGKSRLLQDLRREWVITRTDRDASSSWIENRLLSFETNVPYVLFRRWLSGGLNLHEGEHPADLKATVAKLFDDMPAAEQDRAVTAISQLFARSAARDRSIEIAQDQDGQQAGTGRGDEFRHELIDLVEWIWRRWIEDCGQGIYVIDDFHCADPASAELIEPLLERVSDLPLLVVFAFRPDRDTPAWSLHQHLADRSSPQYSAIELRPLDGLQSGVLFDRLLDGAEFPEHFREAIVSRVGGNPLFAEELVRSLLEQRLVVQSSTENGSCWTIAPNADLTSFMIPDSIQALIQDRVDRLSAGSRQTLQLAAVIGTSFAYADLAAVSEHPGQLDEHLNELHLAMLIRPASPGSQQEYVFHHALSWETVYQSILRRRRRRMHRHIGETLERRYGNQLDQRQLALLSRHFTEAGDVRAVEYSIQAGDRSAALFAPDQAIEYYSNAIGVAQRLQINLPSAHIYHQRGLAFRTIGQYERARQDFQLALDSLQSDSDRQFEWQILLDMGESWEGIDYQRAGEWYSAALESAQRSAVPECIAQALGRLGNWYSNVEQIDQARDALAQALEIYQASGNRRGLAETLDLLGAIEDIAGDAKQMLAYWQQAAGIFEELDDPIRLSSTLAGIAFAVGGYPLETAVTAEKLSVEDALASANRAIELARTSGWRSGEAYALQMVAMTAMWHGYYAQALDTVHEGLEIAEEIEHFEWTSIGWFTIGSLRDAFFDDDGALTAFERAYSLARESGSTFFAYMGIATLSSALIKRGQLASATKLLALAPDDFSTNTISLRKIALSRAELALVEGNATRALEIVERLYASAVNLTKPADIPVLACLRGQALARLGQLEEACDMLEAAIDGAETRGPRFRLWQFHLELGRLHGAAGHRMLARQEFDAARAEIETMDESVSDPDLKSSFLVRALEMVENAEADLDQPD